jgi:serine phosphatase RsbU (regulator of sigma subunit)
MAAQGGQALARAQAFRDRASAASTLQESLLPSRLPRRPELDLTARYMPGERGLRVGGDWYDCVEVGDQLAALVVGDVMGKGLHAGAVM